MKVFCAVLLFFKVCTLFAQVAINSEGALSDSSAILDVKSTSRGLLIPRMTQPERDAIMRPANGLLVFCIDNNRLYFNQGTPENKNWTMVADGETLVWADTLAQLATGYKMMGKQDVSDTNSHDATRFWAAHTFSPTIHTHAISSVNFLQDSLNFRYRISDTSGVLLSRQRAAHDYEPGIPAGTAFQYWNGNKKWKTLNTSVVPEASANLYFSSERVRNTCLAGLTITLDTIRATDSIISAIGKLQGQIFAKEDPLSFNNPLSQTGNSIFIPPSGSLQDGYLKSADWIIFNSKQTALGYTAENQANKSANTSLGTSDELYPTQNAVKTYINSLSDNYISNSINLQAGTFHITGNGWFQSGYVGIGTLTTPAYQLDINGNYNVMRIQTLPVNYSNTSVLVVDDMTGVVSKRTSSFSSGTVTAVTAIPPLSSTGGTAPNISITQAGAGTSGYLSSTDWSTFYGKENALSFSTPLSRAGNTVSLQAASGSQNGYLSSSDYTRLHGTAGSVLFYDANGIQQDNSNCFFDNSNNRLGIGTNTPQSSLSVGGSSQFQVASDGHCTVAGAFGSNSSMAGINSSGTGLTGTGTVYGVFGQSTVSTGERSGGYFYAGASAYARVGGYKQTSPGTYEAYLIWGVGKLVTQSMSSDGSVIDMYSPVSPETVVTDYGTGKLINGKCHVTIDPVITKRIFVSREHPVKVFIQLEDDCKGVYVTNKSADGFDVVELMDGRSDAVFSWSFTANVNEVTTAGGKPEPKNIGVRSAEYRIRE